MKRKCFVGLLLTLLAMFSAFGERGSVPYTEVRSGLAKMRNASDFCSFRDTNVFSVKLGLKSLAFRYDFQCAFLHFDKKNPSSGYDHFYDSKGKVRTYVTSFFFNIYRDFEVAGNFSCSLGSGLGCSYYRYYAKDDPSGLFSTADRWLMSGQIMVELNYRINDQWIVLCGYRCVKLANTTIIDDTTARPEGISDLRTPLLHCFEIGLRYTF